MCSDEVSAFVLQIYIKLLILLAEGVGLFHLAEGVNIDFL
jgi:hypothetical protein